MSKTEIPDLGPETDVLQAGQSDDGATVPLSGKLGLTPEALSLRALPSENTNTHIIHALNEL